VIFSNPDSMSSGT